MTVFAFEHDIQTRSKHIVRCLGVLNCKGAENQKMQTKKQLTYAFYLVLVFDSFTFLGVLKYEEQKRMDKYRTNWIL